MPGDPSVEPVQIAPFPNGEVGIVWADGHESYWASKALRCACRCAACVDETTGVKTLRDESVPDGVRPVGFDAVGRYGVTIRWSDGHGTGIYAFDRLRAECPCDECRERRAEQAARP